MDARDTEQPSRLIDVPLDGFETFAGDGVSFVFAAAIPRNYTTLLSGHGGTGKSMTALTLAAHGACGREYAGLIPDGIQRSVYISLEDDADIVLARLRKITARFNLDPNMVRENVRVLDGTGTDGVMMHRGSANGRLAETNLYHEMEAAAANRDLIIIDNASDALEALNYDNTSVRTFIRGLTQVARCNNSAVLLLAHVDKQTAKFGGAGNSYGGGTAWHNSTRSRLALVAGRDGTVDLIHEKSNYGALMPTIRFRWHNGVMLPITAQDIASGECEFDHAVLDAIRKATSENETVTTATSGPRTTRNVLTPYLPNSMVTPVSLSASLKRLEAQGLIRKHQYQNSNRKQKECWELAQAAPMEATE